MKNPNGESIAFVLPCLNEARTIEYCIRRAALAIEHLSETHGLSGEIIVADNGSTDGSQSLARAAGARVVSVDERGYGAALIGGFAASSATYYVMGDSDQSYDFVESAPMVEKLMQGVDLCMGSRFKGEIKPGAMPWKNRYIGNPVLSGILRLLFKTKISDSHCGLRAIRRSAYEFLDLSSTGMEFASEMVLKSVLKGLKIDEVPVTLSPDARDRLPHLQPWRDGLRHLTYMLLLSPRHLFFLPALIFFCFGNLIFGFLLGNDHVEMVPFLGMRIGDHWAIIAGASIVISAQTAITGCFAIVYSIQRGYRLPTPFLTRLMKLSRLEYWTAAGFALIVSGVIWVTSITTGWILSDFGELSKIRSLTAAMTLVTVGSQVLFSGFLLSIFAGNRSTHLRAL